MWSRTCPQVIRTFFSFLHPGESTLYNLLVFPLHKPSLSELSAVMLQSLSPHYERVEAHVVRCPDLRGSPFLLASEGLCGRTRLAEVGGARYLVPRPDHSKSYNLVNVLQQMDIPDAFVLGSGTCSENYLCEMIANLRMEADKGEKNSINRSFTLRPTPEDPFSLHPAETTAFRYAGNFFASEGKVGDVIQIRATKRRTQERFLNVIRKGLQYHYLERPVGIGGVFLLQKGLAQIQVMPNPSSPISSREDMSRWLQYHPLKCPLVCLTTLVSADPGLGLWLEHTHCYNDQLQGGHFHCDLTPDQAEYVGYFNVAEILYRFDRPRGYNRFFDKFW